VSVLARLMSPRAGAMEQRTLTSSSFVPPPAVGVLDDYVGVHRAMSVMTVYACVRLLADTIASLPWKVYTRDAKGVPKEVRPQPALVQEPWPGFDLFQYKWSMVASLALRGNYYGLITGYDDKTQLPNAIMPLHPDSVFLERRTDILRWFDPVYRVMGEQIPSGNICHIRRFTMPGEPWGLSPIHQAAVAVGMSLASEEYGYRYFKESANPSGMLTTEQDLDERAVIRAQKDWIQSHGGRKLPAVLTGGFKFAPLSIAPNESQFLETRQFQRSEICIMYGVPPILIGDTKETTAWGTGVEQITIGAVTYTFRAWTACIESVFSRMLPPGQYVQFDYSALLKGDIKTRFEAYEKALKAFWITPNEVRAQEEMEPLEFGDEPLQPANFVPLGMQPDPYGMLVKPASAPSPISQTPEPARPEEPPKTPTKAVPGKPVAGGESTPQVTPSTSAPSVSGGPNGKARG
jgi:HK97 family phage portal protein